MVSLRSPRTPIWPLLLALILGCTLDLAEVATPGPGWPDLAAPPYGHRDGQDDAALIITLDESVPGGRAGANEVASGWWRYLVLTRGLRRGRVQLLRNEDASAKAIRAAVERLEERAGTGSVLWMIYIGSASSPSFGGDGQLLAGNGERVDVLEIRDALAAGMHESAFMLFDACHANPEPDELAGVAAVSSVERDVEARVWKQVSRRTYYLGINPDDPNGLLAVIAAAHGRVEAVLRREAGTLRNSFVLTAGLGDECADQLPATADAPARPWPALAYAALGALQGWADHDNDGFVSATEMATHAQSVVAGLDEQPRPDTAARVRAGGVDIILADVRAGGSRWRGRKKPIEPAALSQTPSSIALAKTQIDLQVEDMVPVPPGEFMIGCQRPRGRARADTTCEVDESPRREIELGGYAIDRTEVRWSDYRKCIEAGLCPPLLLNACWVWTREGFQRGAEAPAELFSDDHPVMCVNWVEALVYCNSVGKRLPTEAEWERAARGLDGRTFPWGDEAPTCKHAVKTGCSDYTRPVGTRPAGTSPVGAMDMSGNVSEWVNDWWDKRGYVKLESVNPTGPIEGEVKGVRGGSFYEGASNLRAGYRYGIEPLARLSTVGFRCAR